MRLAPWIAAGGLTFALCAYPLFGQDGEKPAEAPKVVKLPLTRVVLFNAGIGYFHREGTVNGNAKVELKVNEEDVNDLILTLMTNDPAGTARAVTYDNRAPAEITLKSFTIDITENPTVGNLLHQVRGEKVEITEQGGAGPIVGQIISVVNPAPEPVPFIPGEEAPKPAATKAVPGVPLEQVSLLTEDGLQTVSLAKVKKVKFVKPELQAEFRKALEALAAARGASSKTVGVTFVGPGSRKVSLGYVADAPLWKPTYRITVGDGAPKIVGLAAIENTTDEDWENVKVKLVSGRPMTFKMDLYDPLFVPRPFVEQELYASLRPPVYQAPMAGMMGGAFGFGQFGQQGGNGFGQAGFGGGGNNLGVGGGVLGATGGGFAIGNGYGGITRPSVRSLLGGRLDHESYRTRLAAPPGVPAVPGGSNSIGVGVNLGESFEYSVLDPVSLPRFKSALLPIVRETIEAERVSIFNVEGLATHPLKGLKLKNTSKLYLAQGPVTIFEGDTVAGQARLADVKPGESRLLSYAIDLDVAMHRDAPEEVRTLVSMKIAGGSLHKVYRVKATTRYSGFNKGTEAKSIWITQALKKNWKLVSAAKPVETTADLNRFELKLAAGANGKVEIVEETDESVTAPLTAISDDDLKDYGTKESTPPAVKIALGKVMAGKVAALDTANSIADEQAALKEITEEQVRIRANLAVTPKESDAYKRYLKKFDDQEVEIEKRKATLKELAKTKDRQAKEFAELLRTLKAE
jgi:hypothetical protein